VPLADIVRFQAIGLFSRSHGHERSRHHGIDEWVVMVVIAGHGWSELDGVRRQHRPQSLIILPPGRPHAYGADSQTPWTIAWAHLAGSGVDLSQAPRHLGPTPMLRATELLDEAWAALHDTATPEGRRMGCAIAAHLVAVLRQQDDRSDPFRRLLTSLRDNPAKPMDLTGMARQVGLSSSQFLVRFRSLTGTTPIDWLTAERIALACRLLSRSNASIEDLARQCGFSRSNTFTRAFRKRMGLSPSAYRRIGPPG
jgi:AraC-like DNA-binding protein